VDQITAGVRSSMTYAGATTLEQFAARAVVGIQSASGYEEGRARPVSWS
jgi:IMP dehydrogenase